MDNLYTIRNAQSDKTSKTTSKFNILKKAVVTPTDQATFNILMASLNKYKSLDLTIVCPIRLTVHISGKMVSVNLHHTGLLTLNTTNAHNLKFLGLPTRDNKVFSEISLTNFKGLQVLDLFANDIDEVSSVPSMELLCAVDARVGLIKTQKSMKWARLENSLIGTLEPQPSLLMLSLRQSFITTIPSLTALVELNISYSLNIEELPSMPSLKILLCNNSKLKKIPEDAPLTYLLSLESPVNHIPPLANSTLEYIIVEQLEDFKLHPNWRNTLVEYYNESEDVHYYNNHLNAKSCIANSRIRLDLEMLG